MPYIEMMPHAFGPYSTLWSAHRIDDDGNRTLLVGSWFIGSENEEKVARSALRQAPGLQVVCRPMGRKDCERVQGFKFTDQEWAARELAAA